MPLHLHTFSQTSSLRSERPPVKPGTVKACSSKFLGPPPSFMGSGDGAKSWEEHKDHLSAHSPGDHHGCAHPTPESTLKGGAPCWAGSTGLAVRKNGVLAKPGTGQGSFRDHLLSQDIPSPQLQARTQMHLFPLTCLLELLKGMYVAAHDEPTSTWTKQLERENPSPLSLCLPLFPRHPRACPHHSNRY